MRLCQLNAPKLQTRFPDTPQHKAMQIVFSPLTMDGKGGHSTLPLPVSVHSPLQYILWLLPPTVLPLSPPSDLSYDLLRPTECNRINSRPA